MAGVEGAVVGRPLTAELVERAARRPGRLGRDLVHAYQGIAFRTAYLLTGSAADAEDAAQDAFVKAYYALGRFRKGAELRPWLLRIVANEARNRRRSAGRRTHLALRAADLLSGRGPVPRGQRLASEQQEALLAAVNALPEEQREVVACRYFLELSEEETAETLGLGKAPSSPAFAGTRPSQGGVGR